jgi:hypothetical protein
LGDITQALKDDTKLWVAHPKQTSKISTDLNRDSSWNKLSDMGYETIELVSLDHVWQAFNFKKSEELVEEIVEVKMERKVRKAAVA